MMRKCARPECNNEFVSNRNNSKKYCCRNCRDKLSYLKHREKKVLDAKLYTLAHPDTTREYQKNYRDEHKEETKVYSRKRTKDKSRFKQTYGITLIDWQTMFEKQEGRCAICGKHQSEVKRGLNIDHDHVTGKVRGLLCYLCNIGIGSFGDSSEKLGKAILYLEGKGV